MKPIDNHQPAAARPQKREPNIAARPQADGTIVYRVQLRSRANGQMRSLCKTFRALKVAKKWRDKKLAEIELHGFPEPARAGTTVADVIARRLRIQMHLGRSARAVLTNIRQRAIGSRSLSDLKKQDFFDLADDLLAEDMLAQTATGYLSMLVSTLRWARARDEDVPEGVAESAMAVLWEDEVLARSEARSRRVTPDELGAIFSAIAKNPRQEIPLVPIAVFALYSARRLSEICRIRWDDLRVDTAMILVREMKHPRKKRTNDVWCKLTPEALRIIQAMPRKSDRIFPYNSRSVGTAFRRHRERAGIVDLRFHDLRHEAITRLFEMQMTAPFVAKISGHASSACLERYEHVETVGDRFASWSWLDATTAINQASGSNEA